VKRKVWNGRRGREGVKGVRGMEERNVERSKTTGSRPFSQMWTVDVEGDFGHGESSDGGGARPFGCSTGEVTLHLAPYFASFHYTEPSN